MLALIGQAGCDAQVTPLRKPIQRRAGRVKPTVEPIQPVEQTFRKFIFNAAAGDLPDMRDMFAMAHLHVVDK